MERHFFYFLLHTNTKKEVVQMRRIILLVLFFLFALPPEIGIVGHEEFHQLDVHFLDVGQGDATLIILPNQKVILIDGGPTKSGKRIIKTLQRLHIKKIDLVVATHPDIDHIGGLITILKEIKVEKVLDSGKKYNTHTYYAFKNIIEKKNILLKQAKEGKFLHMDPTVKIQILNDAKKKEDNNESSVVLKVSYKKADILLTGDADVFVEEQMLSKGYDISAEVLKVGHHGSYTSTSPRFLENVHPNYAIISYANRNEYGHPHKRVLERLKEQRVMVFRTAQSGMISIHTNGEYLSVLDNKPILLTNNK